MALSNWDTLAFNTDGQPCDGTLRGFDGASAAIYKNWLYVRDPKMWVPGRSFVEPTIAQVTSGNVMISEFDIIAKRHEMQEAIFVLAECHRSEPHQRAWMAGIGCYGFSDPTLDIALRARIDLGRWEVLGTGSRFEPDGSQYHTVTCVDRTGHSETFSVPWDDRLEPIWTGVTAATRDAFFDWLDEMVKEPFWFINEEAKDWVAVCRASGGLRFNQGDHYFVDRDVADPYRLTTPVGQAKPPVIMRMLDKKDGRE